MLNKYTDYVAADPNTWQQSFDVIMQYYQDEPVYLEGVKALYQKMQNRNEKNMGTLSLSNGTIA